VVELLVGPQRGGEQRLRNTRIAPAAGDLRKRFHITRVVQRMTTLDDR